MISVSIPKAEYERARDIADANMQAYLADAAAVQSAAEGAEFANEWGADLDNLNGLGRA